MTRSGWVLATVTLLLGPTSVSAAPAPNLILVQGRVYCQDKQGGPREAKSNVYMKASADHESPIQAKGSPFTDDGRYALYFSPKALDRDLIIEPYGNGKRAAGKGIPAMQHISVDRLERNPEGGEAQKRFVFKAIDIVLDDCDDLKRQEPAAADDVSSKSAAAYLGSAGAAALASAGVIASGDVAAGVGQPCTGANCPTVVSRIPVTAQARVSAAAGGDLLSNARTSRFRALGFRYAPARDTASAVVTNPSASALEAGWHFAFQSEPYNPGSDTAFNAPQVAGRYTSAGGWSAGLGYYYQRVEHTEPTMYDFMAPPYVERGYADSDAPKFWARDSAAVAFVAKRLTPAIAASVGVTQQWHSTCVCDATVTRTTWSDGRVVDSDLTVHTATGARSSSTGMSVGLTWQARPDLRFGVAGTNLGVSRNTITTEPARDRAVGVGAAWFHSRLHLGVDIEQSDILGLSSSVGASVLTPWHGMEVRTGYVSGANAGKAGVTLKNIDYTLTRSAGAWQHYLGSSVRF